MASTVGGDRYLTTVEAAEVLDVIPSTLQAWRSNKKAASPPWVQIGRNVRYRESDLVRWLQGNTVDPGRGMSAASMGISRVNALAGQDD